MKKSLARKITLSILAGAVLMSSSVVWAATDPDVVGWTKNDVNDAYIWKGVSGGAPNGEVNKPSDKFTYDFFGAYDDSNNGATGGKVTINGGTFVDTEVYGGYVESDTVDASDNKVEISKVDENSTFGFISGGEAYGADGNANYNRVTLSAKDATYKYDIYGGYSDSGDANNNAVNISAGTFDDVSIYGVQAGGGASDNKVEISNVEANSTFVYISGGEAYGSGMSAEKNRVTLSAGNATYRDDIYGGYSDSGDANNNAVNISAGTFKDVDIYGGYSVDENATYNTVNISGAADLSEVSLYGGAGYDSFTGTFVRYGGATTPNTLNIGTNSTMYKGKVGGIAGFDVINFESINWEKDDGNDDGVIEVYNLELKDTKVTVGNVRVAGNTTLAAGDDMTLIVASNVSGNIATDNEKATIYKGVAQTVEADVKKDNKKQIYLEIAGNNSVTVEEDSETNPNSSSGSVAIQPNPQVLVIGESRTAATAFTNQGSELIETGLDALARDNSKDTKVFAAVYGNHSEYETGSHVNVNGWSGIVGVGKTNANGLTVGAFFENGDGNYSTHNVTDFGYLRGDGEAVYNGGGFLVRKDNASGVYTEASLRAGNLKNELRGAVIGSQGEMGYDIDTFYYGAHIGVGKIIARGADGDSLDVYGKFIYTHHDGEDFEIDGDEFKFGSVDSERLRVGFRLNEVNGSKATMYYGAAWEYEFGGDADNKVVGYDLSTPSLEGSTVIGEIGMHYKASEKWSIDLNGRAYVGQREGFSGSVQANYSF